MNLQYFAEPAENDDPNIPDEIEDIEEITDENIDEELESLFKEELEAVSEEENNEENKAEEQEEVTKQLENEQEEDNSQNKTPTFTQDDVNRIVQERLARDRKSQLVRELEELAGMDIEGIVNYARQNRIRAKAEEMGISEEEAQRIIENEEKAKIMEEQMKELQAQQQATIKAIKYGQDKLKYINNPLVKKYEKEIDDFAQGGLMLEFEPAMNYILGQKLLNGELLEQMKEGIEKKTLANVTKRSKIAVEKTQTGGQSSEYLSPTERRIAAMLGVSPKEYLEEKQKIQKTNKGVR